MCGRFTNRMSWRELHDLYDITNDDFRPNLRPNYNAAPTQSLPVVRLSTAGERVLSIMRWGFECPWAKSPIINATAEKVGTSNVFRHAFAARRCLVPADGFYEWKKGADGKRQPYRITLMDEEPFAFAGIWETWKADRPGPGHEEGQTVETFCIVTTLANSLTKTIDSRMPAIVDRGGFDAWLQGPDEADLLAPFDENRMTAFPVGTRVNNVRNNDEACLAAA